MVDTGRMSAAGRAARVGRGLVPKALALRAGPAGWTTLPTAARLVIGVTLLVRDAAV